MTAGTRPQTGDPAARGRSAARTGPLVSRRAAEDERWPARLLIALAPALIALWVGATTFPGGTVFPWHPVMVDLDVYRAAGDAALQHRDFYSLPGLPFLYPPFAALLAMPLAVLPAWCVQVGWVLANVAALLAVFRRFGLHGWPLSLVAAATIWFVEPVQQTFAFGQVGIILVALVVVDLVPRTDGRTSRLPVGVLTGIAAAVKLTPGLFAVYLFAAGRRRAAYVTVASFVAASVLAAVALPTASQTYWVRLAHGDTGLGTSVVYYTNQAILADWLRVFGVGRTSSLTGLGVAAVVAVLGVVAAVVWHRLGQIPLAVCLGGLATLLASPVSWSHHFVWVVPIALLLWRTGHHDLRSGPGAAAPSALPVWFRCLGLGFVLWVAAAPFKRLPNGGNVELQFTWRQNLLDSVTALLGVAILVSSLVLARRTVARARRQGRV